MVLVGVGLVVWLWIGSYLFIRLSAPPPRFRLATDPSLYYIDAPQWMERGYAPLIAIDHQLTGERVAFGTLEIVSDPNPGIELPGSISLGEAFFEEVPAGKSASNE